MGMVAAPFKRLHPPAQPCFSAQLVVALLAHAHSLPWPEAPPQFHRKSPVPPPNLPPPYPPFSGGSFEAAVSLAEYFLPQGAPITSTVRFGDVVDAEWRAGQGLTPGGAHTTPPLPLTSRPLVLLTNASTASASELLAGALRDNGRAEVIGERTFGKGVVQEYFGEPDGSGLKLTVAKYITPSGYDITRKGGLAPDLVCHDHPRGLTGRPDVCVARALHSIAGGWTP